MADERYNEVKFLTKGENPIRLTVILDTKGIKEPRLEDKDGNTIANFSGTTGGWLPIDANIKVGNQGINNFLVDQGTLLNNLTTKSIKELPQDAKDKYVELNTFEPFTKSVETEAEEVNVGQILTAIQKQNVDYPTDNTYFEGRYPINQKDTNDFDHFKITCYDHQPSGLKPNQFILPDIDDRKKVRRGVVTLPMQPGIQEGNTVNWGPENINPLQILGLGVANDLMDLNIQGAMDNLLKAVGDGAGDLTPDVIKSWFAGKAIGANVLGRATGQTINNNVEVLFNGPGLRTFNYNYRFTPREPKEAVMIKNIIRFFKKQMAPKRSTSRIFLKSPNVFKLKYVFKNGDHPFLNNIKMCALNGFTVDYTPDGSYSTYSDGGEGDGSMTSYNVGLSFMEMTPIYNEDFFRDSEGKEGTGF